MSETAAEQVTGVTETMLWTLHNRASEAVRAKCRQMTTMRLLPYRPLRGFP